MADSGVVSVIKKSRWCIPSMKTSPPKVVNSGDENLIKISVEKIAKKSWFQWKKTVSVPVAVEAAAPHVAVVAPHVAVVAPHVAVVAPHVAVVAPHVAVVPLADTATKVEKPVKTVCDDLKSGCSSLHGDSLLSCCHPLAASFDASAPATEAAAAQAAAAAAVNSVRKSHPFYPQCLQRSSSPVELPNQVPQTDLSVREPLPVTAPGEVLVQESSKEVVSEEPQ
jgi:hypothetical protein